MKIKFYIPIYLLIITHCLYSQNYNWITPNTTYLKMYVINDGMYRINKGDFTAAGINADNIDPRTIKVFYKGLQVPIFFYGESDGVFNDSDYFDFYGKRNYGGLTNFYNSGSIETVSYVTDEYFDLYSDTSVYWIGWGGSYGNRYLPYNYNSGIQYPYDYYYKRIHFENDLVYSLGEAYSEQDYRNFNNERFKGESWYWAKMLFQNQINQNFNSPLLSTSVPAKLKTFAYPYNIDTTIFNEHRLTFRVNNILIDTLKTDNFNKLDTSVYFPSNYLNGSSLNTISVKYTPPTNFTNGSIFLDYFEIYYPKRFVFDSNYVSFSSELNDTSARVFKIAGFISSNEIKIYDVLNNNIITNYFLSSDTLVFSAKGNGKFEIINKTITLKPFRIKQRQVPNLVSTSNGVDYLIVYNKLFETQAEFLRTYRSNHDNFRAFKAEIEDIYDIFNYGIENPVAVRNFVSYVWNNWTPPKVQYLCLFGRGSTDPKKCSSTSQYFANLVPVYGNPISDGYFANVNQGTFMYYRQIAVGRLPVYTTSEAQDVINKIITYESQPIDNWIKNTSFVTGGYNTSDQSLFRAQANSIINTFLQPPPLSFDITRVFLNDSSGLITYNYSDSIKNSINRGTLFMNYIGHAGNNYWDYTFDDPVVLSNGSKLPLIYSMTCFTGKYAEPNYRGWGEKFLLYSNKGAIGFVGSTGWGFVGSGNTLQTYFASSLSQDTSRRIGEILKHATLLMSGDSLNYYSRNTVNSFNLIGDPALKLLLPPYPEFVITNSDYKLSTINPELNENVILTIYPRNLGTFADSCKIRWLLIKNGLNSRFKDTIIRNFAFIDTLYYTFSLDTLADYNIKIILDVDNWYTRENTNNNSITIPVTLANYSFVPLKPIDNSVVISDSIEFEGINPNINLSRNSVKLLLQLDTTNNFNSSILQTYIKNNFTTPVTKFKVHIPILDTNVVYFWRLNTIVNNIDTLGWSTPRRFIYNPTIINETNIKKLNKKTDNVTINSDSVTTVYKKLPSQYNNEEISFLSFNSAGYGLLSFTGNLVASSWGGDPWEPTYLLVNNTYTYLLRSYIDWGGLYFMKISKVGGQILDSKHIYFSAASSSDSAVSYLNTFDTTHILMAVKLIPVGVSSTITSNLINKLKQFGSRKIDSVNINSWQRWSFISYRTNPDTIVSENYSKTDWAPINSSLQPVFKYINGSLTSIFGPAQYWYSINWNQIIYTGSYIYHDIYGINRNNQPTLLWENYQNTLLPLDTLNAYNFPKIKIVTKFRIDSTNGFSTPFLKSVKVRYTPPSEIVLNINNCIKSDSVINSGDTLGFKISYCNAGFTNLYGSTRNFYTYNINNQKIILKSDTSFTLLKTDSAINLNSSINLSGFNNIRKYNNTIDIFFEVQPIGNQNDYFYYNNKILNNVIVKSVPNQVLLELFSDGLKIQNGDYVRKEPDIIIKLTDNIIGTKNSFDTNDVKLFLNTRYVPYYLRNNYNPSLQLITFDPLKKQISLQFKPFLEYGINNLKVVLCSGNNNYFDTLSYNLQVTSDLLIKDLYNYPNPLKNFTNFVFFIAGDSKPTNCKIKIYTVSGKLIKSIHFSGNIGYNQVYWDARDDDGETIANGIYFYKVIIEGAYKKETDIQKLVILR